MILEQILELLGLLGELGLTVGLPVLVSWVVIRGLKLARRDIGELAKKYVVYGFSAVSVFVFQPIPLPGAADDPAVFAAAVLAFAGATMKAAQAIYDKAWKALEGA